MLHKSLDNITDDGAEREQNRTATRSSMALCSAAELSALLDSPDCQRVIVDPGVIESGCLL